ncbi:hypothetical protein FUAX_10910 [Fulvitalea axinellae]|uniref:Uncharacterized protein n=1 Tax=Fulvitalea axinellae TaxID=1182444 RepID=A0AAU9D2Q4_9BACT|nr:hypothetical protein FUAX_10910 [Fulvitalea axinellae]
MATIVEEKKKPGLADGQKAIADDNRKWAPVYGLVLGALVFFILLFYFITETYK